MGIRKGKRKGVTVLLLCFGTSLTGTKTNRGDVSGY